MMIMRPPQHGHGCESGLGALVSAVPLARRASGALGRCCRRAGAGEQAVVTDAVEALRQDVNWGIPRGITEFLLFW